ncbi:MAG: 2Fe-2S iron-sulfur cluster-binding protein [Candidatus Omnitrophota bacterium]|nr:2Fe-2S iron-sulfur cluster binding domain-containing protein [Candidatus Omnitrophota bacterium]MBU2528431.1 (2Fe-2S)-binding protein [bacterium]MBU3930780.1 (2Fe-2S)-binding protein [bacterium]MBU4123287.1 (2Fe-2S)-binding protein [bacterium]
MIGITIDGKKVETEKDRTILEAALENGFDIPHLCWHPSLEPYASCRVCLVEVEKKGWKTLTTSCTYPVSEGLIIFTDSEKVVSARKVVISQLFSLAPEAEEIKKLARKYGAADVSRVAGKEPDNCIRCGLCIRVCKELIGREAIGFVNRGRARIPETPFLDENPACMACGACAYLCPTGRIKVKDGKAREIEVWHKKEELAACNKCGEKYASLKQVEEAKKKIKNDKLNEILNLCPACRKQRITENFKNTGGIDV